MTAIWTPPADRDLLDVVTVGDWNELLGATGNLQYLKDSDVFARLASDLTKTSSVALSDLTGFAVPVLASEVWDIEVMGAVSLASGSANGGFRFGLTGPASPTRAPGVLLWGFSQGYATAAPLSPAYWAANEGGFGTGLIAAPTDNTNNGNTNPSIVSVLAKWRVHNGANAGTVQVKFAQHTSDSDSSVALQNMTMVARRVG